ncbi:MAG TPA: DNA alkylation repair protein [Bacteroidales bacterium]|nr:DNA alkylation repair protein [Bacteroidales bacterium]
MKTRDDSIILSFFENTKVFFLDHADPEIVKKYSRYFREGYDAWGIDDKTMREQRDLWYGQWKQQLSRQQLMALGDKLMASGKYEESILAINILIQLQKEDSSGIMAKAGEWLESNVSNWAQTDYLSGEVISFLINKDVTLLNDLEAWKKSVSRWRRRAIPVSLIKVMKQGYDPAKLLHIIDPIMSDNVREVHQGLGWFLRETWKKHPGLTEKFLLKWKDTCARLIIQYATEKMDKAQKENYKRIK